MQPMIWNMLSRKRTAHQSARQKRTHAWIPLSLLETLRMRAAQTVRALMAALGTRVAPGTELLNSSVETAWLLCKWLHIENRSLWLILTLFYLSLLFLTYGCQVFYLFLHSYHLGGALRLPGLRRRRTNAKCVCSPTSGAGYFASSPSLTKATKSRLGSKSQGVGCTLLFFRFVIIIFIHFWIPIAQADADARVDADSPQLLEPFGVNF